MLDTIVKIVVKILMKVAEIGLRVAKAIIVMFVAWLFAKILDTFAKALYAKK